MLSAPTGRAVSGSRPISFRNIVAGALAPVLELAKEFLKRRGADRSVHARDKVTIVGSKPRVSGPLPVGMRDLFRELV